MADTKPPIDAAALMGSESGVATPAGGGKFKPFLILCAGVVMLAVGAGYGTALFTGSTTGPAQADAATTEAEPAPEPAAPAATPGQSPDDYVYYDFEPIVVNLDEPRLARYVRVSITLAITSSNKEATLALLDKRKPELKNWMTTFFAGCTLDSVRGAVNLNRLRREILDSLNQQLWPDQKPMVDHVLFKEFAVQ